MKSSRSESVIDVILSMLNKKSITSTSLLGTTCHLYWELLAIFIGNYLSSLLGTTSHLYWELLAIFIGNYFPSLLGITSHLYWENLITIPYIECHGIGRRRLISSPESFPRR